MEVPANVEFIQKGRIKMKDQTFIYELWDLFRIYEDKNIFTKIIFKLLNNLTDMRFIYLDEKDFMKQLIEKITNMLNLGCNE